MRKLRDVVPLVEFGEPPAGHVHKSEHEMDGDQVSSPSGKVGGVRKFLIDNGFAHTHDRNYDIHNYKKQFMVTRTKLARAG